ncbi:MAG: ABC transporter permease, partial [Sphingobacterium sp.]
MNFQILKTAFRKISKNKMMSIINVLSLAIGISSSLVIFLLIKHDYSFDKHVADQDRVYRIVTNGEFQIAGVLSPLLNLIEQEVSGIEKAVPMLHTKQTNIKILKENTQEYEVFKKENKHVFTNSAYFELYPHQWLSGSATTLNSPNNIVLTDKDLKRYFPKLSPREALGKTVIFADSINLQVAGVVKEMQENSDFKFSSFISKETIPVYPSLKNLFNWDNWSFYSDSNNSLIKLKPGVSSKNIESQILEITKKNKKNSEEFKDRFELQPLSDVHFNGQYNYNAPKAETTRNLIILALFLMALGIINFINLSTAQSIERAKEIGIRKTLGSSKGRLTRQFLMETFLITLIAAFLSICLLPVFSKAFEGFVPTEMIISNTSIGWISLFMVVQLIIVTLLAGFYPALVLTGYAPALALKNQIAKNSNLSRSAWVRKTLTVFQFVLAQVFLICVMIVVQQIQFASQRDMGFQKDAIVTFDIPNGFRNAEKGNILKTQLSSFTQIKKVSLANHIPASIGYSVYQVKLDGSTGQEPKQIHIRSGDDEYLSLYEIPLIAGRNVRILNSSTESEVVINERALELFNLNSPEDAIGKTLDSGKMTIVGVMKNFDNSTARSMQNPIMYQGIKVGSIIHLSLDKNQPDTWKSTLN